MVKQYEYKIISYSEDKSLGTVWWDGKAIKSSSDKLLRMLKDLPIGGKSFEDGVEFLKILPRLSKTGYLAALKVNNE